MKLSFKRMTSGLAGVENDFGVYPITEAGEEIEGVRLCAVKTTIDKTTIMTIEVNVYRTEKEEVAWKVANKMTKPSLHNKLDPPF